MSNGLVISIIIFVAAFALWLSGGLRGPLSPLDKIHASIKSSYGNIKHISAEQFEALDPTQTIVFDVREPDEFEVSHIANAIWLAPDTTPEEFLKDFEGQVVGKSLVFYCSVGQRSSSLLSSFLSNPELNQELEQAQSAANLVGGAFAWSNSDRELFDTDQKVTLKVHPYNVFWGRLLKDSANLQYEP